MAPASMMPSSEQGVALARALSFAEYYVNDCVFLDNGFLSVVNVHV
jgi:hypothetical protein